MIYDIIMLSKVMSFLFRSDMEYRYTPKPQHLLWSFFYMFAGGYIIVYYERLWILGIFTFIMGVGAGLVILLAMGWEKATEYWSTLDSFANTMIKSNNPDLWQALGFKVPPQQVQITERKTDDKGNFTGFSFKQLPVSPAVMQSIADKVLLSGNTDFIETNFRNVPNYRKVQKELKKEGYILQKNKNNPRLGYTFSRKGIDTLYQYVSEGVKLELKRR